MSLFEELKRRNVFRVVLAYLVLGWLVLQVADVLVDALELPVLWSKAVVALLAIGFIPAVVFSWVYELTPEGLKKESEVDRSQTITGHTAKKLNVAIVFLLLVAIGLFAYDRFLAGPPGGRAGPGSFEPAGAPPAGSDAKPSLAVLAFDNMSADADNEYFADGISEEILNLLADVTDLSVASRTSAFAFKGKDLPIPEIANALKVRYVLEGSVRKAGDQVRVTAQLIDAQTDRHLWSETFDRALRDVFTIQDEIAAAIGGALQVELLGEGGTEVRSESIDPEVYNRFLEARYLMRRRSLEDLDAANRLLIDIVAADPRFARAHVLLGEVYLLNRPQRNLVEPALALKLANMHASLARSINPNLGGIDMILGNNAGEQHEYLQALEHYRRAIDLEPLEPRPYHWRGFLYSVLGYGKLCAQDLERALELDPQNANVYFALSGCLLKDGNFDRVIELATRGAELGNPAGYNLAIHAEFQRGNQAEALRKLQYLLDDLDVENPGFEVVRSVWEGRKSEAELTEEELDVLDVPELLLLSGKDRVMQRLLTDGLGFVDISQLWGVSRQRFRNDARFIDMLERQGILQVWRELGPPEGCRTEGDGFSCAAKP